MAVETQILVTLKPEITLTEFAILDEAGGDVNSNNQGMREKYQGDLVPAVMLKGYQFNHREIISLEIDESKFLPRLRIQLLDRTGSIMSAYYPRNKPIIHIYIRSRNNKIKPIRNDYLITSVHIDEAQDESLSADGKGSILNITGILYLPQLFETTTNSISNKTSYNALFDIAKTLKLGFATNETSTNDKMTWLCPFTKYVHWINHITKHAYSGDKVFYTTFIDKYYHLNFINITNMFSEEMVFTTAFENIISTVDYIKSDASVNDITSEKEGHDLFLSNFTALKGSDQYIEAYKPITRQGKNLLSNGFKKHIGYYEHHSDKDISEKPISVFIEPYGSNIPKDKQLRSVSDGEWLGIDYQNTHKNYLFGEIIHEHNIREIHKSKLYIRTTGVGLNVIRGSRLPIMIIKEGMDSVQEYVAEVDNEDVTNEAIEAEMNAGIVVDRYLSGFYIVLNIRTIFNPGMQGKYMYVTEYELGKKEWTEGPDLTIK